jgi:hypothetical protein
MKWSSSRADGAVGRTTGRGPEDSGFIATEGSFERVLVTGGELFAAGESIKL